jgi:short-subunit dehydrogenase
MGFCFEPLLAVTLWGMSTPELKASCSHREMRTRFHIKERRLARTIDPVNSGEKRKAVIVGASSGMGRELALLLDQEGYLQGLAGRRLELLQDLQSELRGQAVVRRIDLTDECAREQLNLLFEEMSPVNLVVICAGTGFLNDSLDWEKEEVTIATNVRGFALTVNTAMRHFTQQRSGHLVVITSVAALRGNGSAPAYNASKAFMANYVEGLRQITRRLHLPVVITEVRPGFVDTRMAQGDRLFWVSSPQSAARQIMAAIKEKRRCVYVSKRWRLIAWILSIVPGRVYERI